MEGAEELPKGNALPTYRLPDGAVDLWFGMTMEFDFYMPAGGQIGGEDMVFQFLGDDDVFVYIDDVLVLDIGGTHAANSGSVNFATGAVRHPREDVIGRRASSIRTQRWRRNSPQPGEAAPSTAAPSVITPSTP